ncbi:hypothetical protein LTR36_009234 [Oleoguttula mirabilis]|uniref:Uncharacterized protein n=1 Tax=Oleoguttula mirabilis TaxID=1507867 RepID=A0AAV9J6F0_9PEZI|nr:hypothetical protein LTR36_009234 [Oleoguttula mirabilis]
MRMSNDFNGANGAPLSRQVTVTLNPEDYERLFFQPSQAKGDLSKRLGNPTLIGLLGFLIPFSTTVFCLLEFRGTNPTSLTAISGAYYFIGGIAMNLAGIFELILGNTFPGAVFIVYGCHWCQIAYADDPAHNLVGAYTADGVPGGLNLQYNSGNAMYNVAMTLTSFVFFLGSLRTNAPFSLAIFCLIFLFAFLAAGDFQIGYNPTVEGTAHAFYLIKIGGGFAFVSMVCGWYLAIITVCASTGVPCPLPIFDLSTKIGAKSRAAQLEHAGAVREPVSKA